MSHRVILLLSDNICVCPSDQTVMRDPKCGDHRKDVRGENFGIKRGKEKSLHPLFKGFNHLN